MEAVQTTITMNEAKNLAAQWGREDRHDFINYAVERAFDGDMPGDFLKNNHTMPNVEGVDASATASVLYEAYTDGLLDDGTHGVESKQEYQTRTFDDEVKILLEKLATYEGWSFANRVALASAIVGGVAGELDDGDGVVNESCPFAYGYLAAAADILDIYVKNERETEEGADCKEARTRVIDEAQG